MRSLFSSPLLFALVSLLFLQTGPLFGQTEAAAPKVKKIPFHGKIVALDVAAGTITLNGKTARVLHITADTKVIDGSGTPTTLSTATVGEEVGGSYTKDASGLLTAAKLRIGAKVGGKSTAAAAGAAPAPEASTAPAAATTPAATAASDAATTSKPEAAKKTRFSGKVTAVDAGAGTITIKARTFTVTSTTAITDSTGAAATLADVAVGTKVTGSYEKSADGATLTVETLKIAK